MQPGQRRLRQATSVRNCWLASAECEVDRLLGCKCSSCGELVPEANRAQSCKKQLQCSCTFPSLVGFEEGAEVRHERVASAEQACCDDDVAGLGFACRDPGEGLNLGDDCTDVDRGRNRATVELERMNLVAELVFHGSEVVELPGATFQVAQRFADRQAFFEHLCGLAKSPSEL